MFEAPFAGIYALVTVGGNSSFTFEGGGTFNSSTGNDFPASPPTPAQRSWVIYLTAGAKIYYNGPTAQLAGVRLGDELSE